MSIAKREIKEGNEHFSSFSLFNNRENLRKFQNHMSLLFGLTEKMSESFPDGIYFLMETREKDNPQHFLPIRGSSDDAPQIDIVRFYSRFIFFFSKDPKDGSDCLKNSATGETLHHAKIYPDFRSESFRFYERRPPHEDLELLIMTKVNDIIGGGGGIKFVSVNRPDSPLTPQPPRMKRVAGYSPSVSSFRRIEGGDNSDMFGGLPIVG